MVTMMATLVASGGGGTSSGGRGSGGKKKVEEKWFFGKLDFLQDSHLAGVQVLHLLCRNYIHIKIW